MSCKFDVTGEVIDDWVEKEFRNKGQSTIFVTKGVYFCVGEKWQIWTPHSDYFDVIPENTETIIIPLHFNYEKFNEHLNHMDCVALNLETGELFFYRSNQNKNHWQMVRSQLKPWLCGGLGSMSKKKIYCNTAYVETCVADTCGQVASITMRLLAKGKETKLLCKKRELVAITKTLKKCKQK